MRLMFCSAMTILAAVLVVCGAISRNPDKEAWAIATVGVLSAAFITLISERS
jgi:hypothetical protein